MPRDIQFGEPCGPRWADMPARGAGRYCARCDQTVIDVSRLTRKEALARIRAGRVCGRAVLDPDGEPIFKREPTRLGVRALAMVGALAGGCASAEGGRDEGTASVERVDEPPPATAAASMQPVAAIPEGVAVDELGGEELARLDAQLEEMSGPPVPTEEQRRLTAAKRRRRARSRATSAQPPPQVFMGMMIEPDY